VYGLHDVSDRSDHELGLLVLDAMAALLGDDVLARHDDGEELGREAAGYVGRTDFTAPPLS
jgi:hypothetical protein